MKIIKCFFIFIIGLFVCYITMALIGTLEVFTAAAILYCLSVYIYYFHKD